MDRLQLDPATLPAGEVAVGATWERATDSVLLGIPVPSPAKLASTLAEIKTVDGRRCALIKSAVSPSDQKLNARKGGPDLEVSGEIETLFDIEAGYSRSVNTRLEIKVSRPGLIEQVIAARTLTALDSVKALPPEEAARAARLIHKLVEVAARVADGDYGEAADALDMLIQEGVPAAWKTGVEKTAQRIKFFKGADSGRPAPPAAPAPAAPGA
jgi:hypothetical protein